MIEKIINVFKIINILIVFIFSLILISDYYAKDEYLDSKYLYNNKDSYNKVNVKYDKVNYSSNNVNYKNNNINILIPKIKLNKSVVKANENFSNLDNNLVYYRAFNVYDKNIIFGHSGLSFGTYFNRIDELSDNDFLYIIKDNIKYKYTFKSKYVIDETDTFILNNEIDSKKLLLITCHKIHKNKRIVVEFTYKCTKNVEN